MRKCINLLLVLALSALAAPAGAAVATYVNDTFDGYANGSSILADDPAHWTLSGDAIPSGSTATATISTATSVSPDKSLKLVTDSGEALLRPRWNRDLSGAPASAATPMTAATVSFDFHYNYDNSLSDQGGLPVKGYAQDEWIYVRNHANQVVGQIRANGGYYDWRFGTNYKIGTSARGVRENNWYHLDIAYDFAAQTATYYLDNVMQYSESVAGLLDGTAGLTLLQFENGINGPSGVEDNTNFVDNVVYTADIVPEPACLGLLGLGALLIGRRLRG